MYRYVAKSFSSRFYVVAALITVLSGSGLAGAQVNPGTPSFSAYDSHQYDTVNLQNLNVVLNVPVMSKSGALPFNASLVGGDSYFSYNGSTLQPGILATPLVPSINGLLSPFAPAVVLPSVVTSVTCPSGNGTTADKWTGWYLQMPDGTVHSLPASDVVYGGASCSSTLTDTVIDGTGWTVTIDGGTFYNSSQAGVSVVSSGGIVESTASLYPYIEDAQSTPNKITYEPPYQEFFDTLGVETLTVNANADGQLGWFDVNGGNPTESQTLANVDLKTSFGCSGKTDYPATYYAPGLTTAIAFPDGTSIGLAWEPNEVTSTDYTGRLKEITLRGGGTITYNWNPGGAGAPYGFNCTYLMPNKVTRTTSDGTVSYTLAFSLISGSAYKETDTKIDIGGNKTVYTFTGLTSTGNAAAPVIQALTEVQSYINTGTIASPTYSSTPAKLVIYCYNSSSPTVGNCPTASVSAPITEVDTFTQLSGMSNYARQETQYDGGPSGALPHYGNVTYSAQYNFGATVPTRATTITYGSVCGSGSTVNNKPCSVITTENDSGTGTAYTVAYSKYSYDTHGNLLTTYVSPNGGTSFLSNPTVNSYNSNGTPSVLYDLANNSTTYSYSSTGYTTPTAGSPVSNFPFATSVTKGGLTTSATYDSMGGVKLTDADANGNVTTYGYESSGGTADPWWRLRSVTDPLSNETWITPTATSVNSSFEFNSSASIQNVTTTLDGYGRQQWVQQQQGPSSSNYDTVFQDYGWAASGGSFVTETTVPATCPILSNCNAGYYNLNFVDMLGRPVGYTNSGGGYSTTSYSENDVLNQLYPAPSGEQIKQVQKQYDGLGRLTSSCAVSSTATGNVSCGQNVATSPTNGILTTTSYSSAIGSQTVSSTRGVQTRSQTLDGLGRVTSITTPEGGTITNYYDSYTGSICGETNPSWPGHLVVTFLANRNYIAYQYDSLGRVTLKCGVFYNGSNASNVCRRFAYDNSAGVTGTLPSGISPANPYGRMVEAETDNCDVYPPTSSSIATDEWFSYDKDGHVTTQWEKTPNSGTYYQSAATFTGPMITALQLVNPDIYTVTYGLDGEGRWNAMKHGAQTEVPASGVIYNAASQPTNIVVGTDTDYDGYGYDPNTGRMTSWTFQVGSTPATETAALTWNANGTLKQLAITDGFNSGGTQTCSFNSSLVTGTGYDDLGRLIGSSCGTGGSLWNQGDSYDQYDNLTKSSTGFVSWNPGYSATTNHYTCTGCTYDLSGDVTNDGTNAYTWDAFNKMLSINLSGTNCASAGECLVYDAFGRVVEVDSGSTNTEIWYTQLGKNGFMNGSSRIPNHMYWPAPGGATFLDDDSTAGRWMHKDWLGSVRLSSSVTDANAVADRALAPYGEVYDIFGSTGQFETMFGGGLTQDVLAGIYDTPNRELQGSQQGRWLSPDPANSGWNQYAYPTNPNSGIDPSGLECLIDCDDPGGWGGIDGGSGFGGTDGLSGNYCDATDDPFCIPSPITPPGLPGGGGGGAGGSGGAGGPGASPTGGGIGGQGLLPGQDCVFCFSLGSLLGGLFPCQTDFGAPCVSIGSDFTTVPGYQPPTPAQLEIWQLLQDMTDLFWDEPGPPTLCRQNQCGLPTISGPELPVVSAVQPSTLGQAQAACTVYSINANNGFGGVGGDSANASIWNGTNFQQYTQYPRPTTMNPSAPNIYVLSPLASPSIYIQASYQNCVAALGFSTQ